MPELKIALICAGNRPPDDGYVGDESLTIINITNPLTPVFLRRVQGAGTPNFLSGLTHVAIKDDYAFVCGFLDDHLAVVDISNVLAPHVVASLSVPGIYDIKIKGNYAFVVTGWDSELVSIDISNPVAPVIASSISHAEMGWPVSFYIQGDYAYIASESHTLHIFNISDPVNISFAGYVRETDGAEQVTLGAIKDTWITSSVPTYNGGSDPEMRVINNLGFYGAKAAAFLAFDVSSLAGKTITSAILHLSFFASSAEGKTHWVYKLLYNDWVESELTYQVYKAGSNWAVGGLFSAADFVTTNPSGASAVIPPLGVGYVEWDITAILQDAVANGINVNIVIVGQTGEFGTIRYDSREAILSGDRPRLTISYAGTPNRLHGACYVVVDGDYAYVSAFGGGLNGNGSLTIVDVSNPAAPTIVGSLEGLGALNHMNTPVGLCKSGNYVYVCAFGEQYFNIVDVSDPANPSLVAGLDLQAALGYAGNPQPREVVVIDNYAYVTAGEGDDINDGFFVIDVSNPLAMSLVSSIQGGGAPNFLLHPYGLAVGMGMATPPKQVGGLNPAIAELAL